MSVPFRVLVRLLFCALLLLAAAGMSSAQGWLPISPDDLAMKDNPADPGADAMILYRENVVDSRRANYGGDSDEEYVRIKIFTQQGTQEGHVEIPFQKEYLEVKDVDGRTIKPDGTIVKFTGQVLETTEAKYAGTKILVKSLTLPDVTPGCIVEYRYRLQGQPGWVHSEAWTISSSMFTREAHFRFWPDSSPNSPAAFYRTLRLPKDAVIQHEANGSLTMTMTNIPAVVEEPLMPPRASLETRVDFYYQGPDAHQEAPLAYWTRIGKQRSGEVDHFIDKKSALSSELAKIVAPTDSPETKLRKIYTRTLQIRNLSMEDFKTEKERKTESLKENANVEDVLNRGAAYSRQINFLLVGLARSAGFEAAEVYVAPRNENTFEPEREDASELRADVVWVRAGGKEYYLDPASRYYPFGLLPWYETNAAGLRVTDHGSDLLVTPAPSSSDAMLVRHADLTLSDDGSISGVLQIEFGGQRGAVLREGKRKEDETGRIKDIEDEVKEWMPVGSTFEISKLENWDDIDMPVRASGSVKIPSLASTAVQHMLIPREIFQPLQMSYFVTEKRVNPVYFSYPYEEADDISIHAPAGYVFQAVPKDQKIDLGAASYEISTGQQGSTAEVRRHLALKGEMFTKEQYPRLRAFFGTVKVNDAIQMVLQNGQSAKAN
jgi:Domain of Unknown Function with PDB structure (DUF3857)/Domain of Unknown Function with PDB structure (DUF3858)